MFELERATGKCSVAREVDAIVVRTTVAASAVQKEDSIIDGRAIDVDAVVLSANPYASNAADRCTIDGTC